MVEGSRELTVMTVEVVIVEGSVMGIAVAMAVDIAVGTAGILESLAGWW